MSDSISRQVVILTVSYDPEVYDAPGDWDWTELTGSYCRVLRAGSIEEVFAKESSNR
jgi:hypothetical protein